MYAFRSRPKNMVDVVMMLSRVVLGSMSRGTSDVTIPAPQKNECMYLVTRLLSCFSQYGGCHAFWPAYQGES